MKTLILDLASVQTVCLIEDGIIKKLLSDPSQKTSDSYMKLIDECLKSANIDINAINEFAINLGPGSFTGLRVAVAIAKGLGYDNSIKFKAFSTFDYVSADNVVVAGFSTFVYVKNKNGEMACEDINELRKTQKYTVFDENLYEKMKNLGYKVQILPIQDYASILRKQTKFLKINELEPIYLRKSQAELQREKMLNNKK